MIRDTADMFKTPERGRFGDNGDDRPGTGAKVAGASDLIDVTLRLIKNNPLSIAVVDPARFGAKWIFLPKSQIEFIEKSHGLVEVTLPSWLAREKGLV